MCLKQIKLILVLPPHLTPSLTIHGKSEIQLEQNQDSQQQVLITFHPFFGFYEYVKRNRKDIVWCLISFYTMAQWFNIVTGSEKSVALLFIPESVL